MRPMSNAPSPPGSTAWFRGIGLLALLAALTLGHIAHAAADGFDARKGRRLLGAALSSSAVEHTLGGDVSTPRTPEQLLLMFLINPRYNAYVVKHPEVVPSLLDRMAEPGFLIAMYQAALDPEAYLHFLEGWTDVEKMRSYLEVLDPAVFMAWANTLSNPGFYMALYDYMAEPRKLRAWIAFALGSRLNELVAPPLDPRAYLTWLTLPLNPKLMSHLQGPLRLTNPAQWFTIAGTLMASGQEAIVRFAAPQEETTSQGVQLAEQSGYPTMHLGQP